MCKLDTKLAAIVLGGLLLSTVALPVKAGQQCRMDYPFGRMVVVCEDGTLITKDGNDLTVCLKTTEGLSCRKVVK